MEPDQGDRGKDAEAGSLLWEAGRLIRSSSWLTSLMFNLVPPRSGRACCILCYAYFRMLDDQIDQDEISPDSCLDLLSRHKVWVDRLFGERASEYTGDLPEDFLVQAGRLDRAGALRKPVLQMISSMELDCRNVTGYPTWSDQTEAVALEARAYLRVLSICCGQGEGSCETDLGAQAGVAARIVHNLRDLQSDLRQGKITVPLDEISAGNMTPTLDPPAALLRWARDKKRLARSLFSQGKAELAADGASLRYRICFAILCAKYEAYLGSPVSWLVRGRRFGVALIWILLFPLRFVTALAAVSRRGT